MFAVKVHSNAIELRKPVETEESVPPARTTCAVELLAAPNWTTVKFDAAQFCGTGSTIAGTFCDATAPLPLGGATIPLLDIPDVMVEGSVKLEDHTWPPAVPGAPARPGEPVLPCGPVAPAAPVAPVAPVKPVVPVEPVAPVAPVGP